MENGLTYKEELTFGEAMAERRREAAANQIRAREEEKSLSASEKVTFGIAAAFSTVALIVCVFLTIMGFIFSPVADTLLFGVLMIATGISTYVIWRGGRRSAS
ncbi:MAG: hypothetical protein ACYC6B_05180 [Thermoleophilia bacterium]